MFLCPGEMGSLSSPSSVFVCPGGNVSPSPSNTILVGERERDKMFRRNFRCVGEPSVSLERVLAGQSHA